MKINQKWLIFLFAKKVILWKGWCFLVRDITQIPMLRGKNNLTENMKNTDMFYWVGTMNSIKNQAEEIVYNELIYA